MDPFSQPTALERPGRPRLLWWIVIGLIFTAGLAVRLYDLADAPLDFHATRQLHAALIARGMYFQQRSDIPAWQREIAVSQWRMEGEIEPQVLERVTAWVYGLVGDIDLRIPRLISIFAWLAGAVFLVRIALRLAGWTGALAAAWFFLLWPYAVIASRSFQPEPLLMMLVLAALGAALGWERKGSWGWAAAAGLLAGCALYIKAVAAFIVGPALLVLAVARYGKRWFRTPQVWLVGILALLPYAIYHVYGVYIRGTLAAQFSLRFFPQMWGDPAFYLRWINNLERVLPVELVLASFLGAFLLRRPAYRVFAVVQWVGYVVYGMALPHHISTHDYYHLLLFPVLALGFAGLADVVVRGLRGPGWLKRTVVVGILAALVILNGYEARTALKRYDGHKQARAWEEIGERLGPGAQVAALVPDYGSGLKYWAWINPSIWPTVADIAWRAGIGQQADFSTRFEEQVAGKDYFVVTLFDDLDQQPDLKALLYDRYHLMWESADYLVFDLR